MPGLRARGPCVPTGSAAERAEELLSNADWEAMHKRSRAVHRLQQLATISRASTPTLTHNATRTLKAGFTIHRWLSEVAVTFAVVPGMTRWEA